MTEEFEIGHILASYEKDRKNLLPILIRVQEELGYLPESVMRKISNYLGIQPVDVYAVASFYTQFRLLPLGKKRVAVCRGTACHIRGASTILKAVQQTLRLKEGETSEDLEYTLETVACIGCCALAPVVRINKEVFGKVNVRKIKKILQK
ncbi:MAG: NADH-quinone oxidoreductase subunit NuoE [Thermodesulfovibrio sp.]|nr:NADH-quinone oxidoreductase subunit NuoE [Thermodesulfovibrio sp.]